MENRENPIKSEAYEFILCLKSLKKGFNPDFIHIVFGPYICNKLSRSDGDIRDAVKLWCSDPAAAEAKYGHISQWDVSHVTDMSMVFKNAHNFNMPLGRWDVSNVTNMYGMFSGAVSFNQPIGNWDVSNVTNMRDMFLGAESFNQPIGNWDVSNVTNMIDMFCDAESFNHHIDKWDVSKVANKEEMLDMFFECPIDEVKKPHSMLEIARNAEEARKIRLEEINDVINKLQYNLLVSSMKCSFLSVGILPSNQRSWSPPPDDHP